VSPVRPTVQAWAGGWTPSTTDCAISQALVFPDSQGGHLRRHYWRRRVWIPALERAGVAYFRSYDLRHACATLLLYEGRTLNEVAERLGHADSGFTARTYAHVMRDAARRRITISEGSETAAPPPAVDPGRPLSH